MSDESKLPLSSQEESESQHRDPPAKKQRRADKPTSGVAGRAEGDSNDSSVYAQHAPGSIVRIRLANFLTYSAVEFFPGPNLNMVIGPNGTGKSTIVCAIALGLCGKPEVLGRARELQEFVKHGEKKAMIETELKAPDGGSIVITRMFERGKNTSSWKLNGEKVTAKEVERCVESLSIQVDNLCQFLPQDKVSGFAQMSSYGLLRETERAAGGQEMIDWHDSLIEQRDKEKSINNVRNHAAAC
eukprot:jgi/Hompol1/1541/HPOL_005624-RA